MGKRGRRRVRARRDQTTAPQSKPSKTETPQKAPTAEDLSPEERRATVARQLSRPGQRRLELTTELASVDETLRPLILDAVEAGLPYRRIADLTGLSRATVGRWVKEDQPPK